jgi:hypothetical protein
LSKAAQDPSADKGEQQKTDAWNKVERQILHDCEIPFCTLNKNSETKGISEGVSPQKRGKADHSRTGGNSRALSCLTDKNQVALKAVIMDDFCLNCPPDKAKVKGEKEDPRHYFERIIFASSLPLCLYPR